MQYNWKMNALFTMQDSLQLYRPDLLIIPQTLVNKHGLQRFSVWYILNLFCIFISAGFLFCKR